VDGNMNIKVNIDKKAVGYYDLQYVVNNPGVYQPTNNNETRFITLGSTVLFTVFVQEDYIELINKNGWRNSKFIKTDENIVLTIG
jgi:hypothetical protein